jgi:DNA-binding LacI/PurR family transcriptional regulator
MASVRQIAREAGVSITTVSRALNNDSSVSPKTRELVLSIANRAGYAATMGRRVTTYVALAYTGPNTLSTVYDTAVMEGIVKGVDECRFDVVILNMQRDKKPDENYTQFFMRKGVRGVLLRTTGQTRHMCEAIAEEGFPAVVISERFESPDVSYIDCDSGADSLRAVEYLIELGHRRIAFAMNVVADRDHLDRFAAYKTALQNHGLAVEEGLVLRHAANLAGGATVMEMLVSKKERPTAVYFADPLLAVGAMNKAHGLGVKIPAELSVVGFDDANVRHSVFPTLTAVCQDAVQLGFESAAYLTRVLAGSSNGTLRRTVPTFFEINQSTGPPS